VNVSDTLSVSLSGSFARRAARLGYRLCSLLSASDEQFETSALASATAVVSRSGGNLALPFSASPLPSVVELSPQDRIADQTIPVVTCTKSC
jgi:hypothetical protein